MTDNEIIKALECCGEFHNKRDCSKCPYCNIKIACSIKLKNDALDLINRQKAEIEEYQKHIDNDIIYVKSIKAEAVKEFADKLIQKIVNTPTKFESSYCMYRQGIAYRQNEILDIIKEMVGENND